MSPDFDAVIARLDRLFALDSPDAPGLVFAGAEIDGTALLPGLRRFNAAGVGTTRDTALAGCVGEAVEILSQIERDGDVAAHAAPRDVAPDAAIATWLAAHGADPAQAIDWVAATRLADGAPALLPADLCLRRAPGSGRLAPMAPLSLGCGAGATLEQAWLHGLLERIERDAVALWWRGGAAPRAPALGTAAPQAAATLLATARGGAPPRRAAWLLDITTDLGIPCIAALSADAEGFAVALGAASRPDPAAAARAAIQEMCQLELARHLLVARHREGAATSAGDQALLHRLTMLDAHACTLLHGGPPAIAPPSPVAPSLAGVVSRLAAHGIYAYAVALSRPELGIAAGLVACPALEDAPGRRAGPRLLAMRARTGGPPETTQGVALM